MAAVLPQEAKRRAMYKRERMRMREVAREAFTERAMLDHASLIVWSKAQMRGLRAVIRRLRLV